VRAVDIIIKKRDGGALAQGEIAFFVDGVTSGAVPDYQAAAWLMAVLLKGMSAQETAWLTDAMVRSGRRVDLSALPGTKVDKHSTGGVGDKTSIVLAPIAAACGVLVPMMSGRGLGHTGGTLDKLESIPGFRVQLTADEMMTALRANGYCLIGQSAEVAPADKVLYALRDVTGTIESIPLISASIMSKKIAEGIDALVLDVKCGSGAFMKSAPEAQRLATSLVAIGRSAGLHTEAVITPMDVPLGRTVGNALEVIECLDVLRGEGPGDLIEVTFDLAARMLLLGKVARDRADAEEQVHRAVASGAALDRLRRIIRTQGGDEWVVDDPSRLPQAPERELIRADRQGYVTGLDAALLGRAAVALGAGRDRVDDRVDPAVGIVVHAPPGAPVSAGEAVLELHYRDRGRLDAARPLAQQAIVVSEAAPQAAAAILAEVR
jgi:pyrimidine-nucleoside phosphorylase